MPIVNTLAAVNVRGLRFAAGSVEFRRDDVRLGSVFFRLDATGDEEMKIHVRHRLDSADDTEGLRLHIHTLVDNLITELAFVTDISCGNAVIVRDDIDDVAIKSRITQQIVRSVEDGSIEVGTVDSISASVRPGNMRVTRELIVSPASETRLAETLGAAIAHPYKAVYAAILRTTDPIGRFILLYGLLMLLVGGDDGKQRAVDSWLEKKRPDIEWTVRKDRRGKVRRETIYTRLRNEIAHGIESGLGVELDQTRRRVRRILGETQAVVREAIHESLKH